MKTGPKHRPKTTAQQVGVTELQLEVLRTAASAPVNRAFSSTVRTGATCHALLRRKLVAAAQGDGRVFLITDEGRAVVAKANEIEGKR